MVVFQQIMRLVWLVLIILIVASFTTYQRVNSLYSNHSRDKTGYLGQNGLILFHLSLTDNGEIVYTRKNLEGSFKIYYSDEQGLFMIKEGLSIVKGSGAQLSIEVHPVHTAGKKWYKIEIHGGNMLRGSYCNTYGYFKQMNPRDREVVVCDLTPSTGEVKLDVYVYSCEEPKITKCRRLVASKSLNLGVIPPPSTCEAIEFMVNKSLQFSIKFGERDKYVFKGITREFPLDISLLSFDLTGIGGRVTKVKDTDYEVKVILEVEGESPGTHSGRLRILCRGKLLREIPIEVQVWNPKVELSGPERLEIKEGEDSTARILVKNLASGNVKLNISLDHGSEIKAVPKGSTVNYVEMELGPGKSKDLYITIMGIKEGSTQLVIKARFSDEILGELTIPVQIRPSGGEVGSDNKVTLVTRVNSISTYVGNIETVEMEVKVPSSGYRLSVHPEYEIISVSPTSVELKPGSSEISLKVKALKEGGTRVKVVLTDPHGTEVLRKHITVKVKTIETPREMEQPIDYRIMIGVAVGALLLIVAYLLVRKFTR